MTTVSDVFSAADAGGGPVVAVGAGRGARARARARVATTQRDRKYLGLLAAGVRTAVLDLRAAWWIPASLPTLRQAWTQRIPDRATVPGDNSVLYAGWIAYNHTIGLLVPTVALAVVGGLTPVVWAARHPARLILTALIAVPLYVLIFR
jgi:hypothetical protein